MATAKADEPRRTLSFGSGDAPQELLNVDQFKHRDQKIFSLIDIPLWDRANWTATLYAHIYPPDEPPINFLGLAFQDEDVGKAIFRKWQSDFGDVDRDEAIRISVITGVNRENPFEYAVTVGPNFNLVPQTIKFVVFISRINHMMPKSHENLDRFKACFQQARKFYLVPSTHRGDERAPETFNQFAIEKQEILFRAAWEIGDNDPDIAAIDATKVPVIPSDIENPPILQALRKRKLRRAKRRE